MQAITTITTLKEHARYIDDFLWVMDYVPEIEKNEGIEINEFNSIRIENIYFKYHESKDFVINNLSFNLNRGDKIAIVGHNGSGKTTLIKLILKFYALQDGSMYINDINYNEVNPFSLRKNIAVVFQDYQIYAVSIAENILMRKVKSKEDEDVVYQALDKVGLLEKVKSLNGTYRFITLKFPYFNTNQCVWLEDEYSETHQLALSKIDGTYSKIYGELKTNQCQVIPVFEIAKYNLQ